MARRKLNSNIPTFDELLIPTICALQQLGGSGSIEEVNGKVYEIAQIHDDVLQIPHGEDGTINEVDYRLAWSRTYLKNLAYLKIPPEVFGLYHVQTSMFQSLIQTKLNVQLDNKQD